jgi:hypothetical protein
VKAWPGRTGQSASVEQVGTQRCPAGVDAQVQPAEPAGQASAQSAVEVQLVGPVVPPPPVPAANEASGAAWKQRGM